jgi:hypothetical protein
MKPIALLLLSFFCIQTSFCQDNPNTLVLKTILTNYYKKEKPVYKGRSQLLYLYCNQANNNEELVEAIQNNKLPADFIKEIRTKIATDVAEKSWSAELNTIFEKDSTNLKIKIVDCLTLEKYHEVSQRLHLNNQRLMIISKPLFYSKSNIALVKVAFYRNIEHNSGSILLLEKINNHWIIKDFLNSWST